MPTCCDGAGGGKGRFVSVLLCAIVCIQVTVEEDVRRKWIALRASGQRMVVAVDGARSETVSSTRYVRLDVGGFRVVRT